MEYFLDSNKEKIRTKHRITKSIKLLPVFSLVKCPYFIGKCTDQIEENNGITLCLIF